MQEQLLVTGAGIGGLAAAWAAARHSWQVRVYEQTPVFGEIGAGIQLGPNVTRILSSWGMGDALAAVAARPDRLMARDALTGAELASMPLGNEISARHGSPYFTVHRADLHALLLDAVRGMDGISLHPAGRIVEVRETADATGGGGSGVVHVRTASDLEVEADALVGADGIWSTVRAQLLGDGPAEPSGHVAYRAVLPQSALPERLRSQSVTAWLGPRLHAVTYPLRGGELLNLVFFVEGRAGQDTDAQTWDHAAVAADLQAAMGHVCTPLRELAQVEAEWRLWVISDREPLSSANQMARGRIALLGDAAHPMRPYVAQGAGMAIEDAQVLGPSLALAGEIGVPSALSRYANLRWQRAARVQARSRRNGRIFHLDGPMRHARDVSLRLFGARLMDIPWLYGARL
ncbi:FAD-dependent monooxygenase [Variovorax sp. VNK109]|jgi:salicylate hydroxylase|uniref:FAD-dependent monooxygenase n=1 Tax=Variovorax sp. VNK109 TaxID=3400919 RepID=UPI003BFC0ECD